jgi:hypothetical protein
MNLNASANHCAVAPTKAPSATDSMSARVILHIGHPKMVSSVFQAFLAHNHHNLRLLECSIQSTAAWWMPEKLYQLWKSNAENQR